MKWLGILIIVLAIVAGIITYLATQDKEKPEAFWPFYVLYLIVFIAGLVILVSPKKKATEQQTGRPPQSG